MKQDDWITADEAKHYLGVTTREAVIAMINRDELPGARKVSNKLTATYIIPMSAIMAHPNYTGKKQRG